MIEFKNLTKSYKNIKVLNGIDFIVNDGDFVSIYGESGCGKSTLLNIIGLLDSFESGELIINGENIRNINSKKAMLMRRNTISYLFQSYALIDDKSVRENLLMALEYKKKSKKEKITMIKNTLVKIGLLDKIDYDVYELSGGEQQRIAMARTILHDTDIILADEPTGSLDPKNKKIIIDLLLKENKKGKTIIVATHDESIKNISDNTILLKKLF